MQTGENEQALRRVIDFTRFLSLLVLFLHFYLYGYAVFQAWGFTAKFVDHLLLPVSRMTIFHSVLLSKLTALLLAIVSLLGSKGKKSENLSWTHVGFYSLLGLLFYFGGVYLYLLPVEGKAIFILYLAVSLLGYLFILTAGSYVFRILKINLAGDIFNRKNETFPQEERLLDNEFSVNLPASYCFKTRTRRSWINIINPFRGTLICGNPGSGKSTYVVRFIITQHIQKGFSMLLYDFKYDDLSRIAYNTLLRNQHAYKVKPRFYVINLEKVMHRCNPLEPDTMFDITDAIEASRTVMLGLNREWIRKQGDFFVESPINFVTALIWFLKNHNGGKYCTLPHAIELSLLDYEDLFAVLSSEPEIEVLINPFISAYNRNAMPQLEGQVASAKNGLARLASPQLYYILSGNDFTLDINNPDEPKIVCIGNNPQKLQIYGAVLSLYISRMIKLVNRKNQLKSSLIFDEFPTIFFNNMDGLIATARSNKVATTLAVQDFSQLTKDYGAEQADVITGIVGNIISGQVTGDTAKKLSENFGKIVQDKNSMTINSSETSISKATQLDYAIPACKIAALSSGEFVGMVADNPEQRINLKMFHAEVQNDHEAIAKEGANYKTIPEIDQVSEEDVLENYTRIKAEIDELIRSEMALIEAKSALYNEGKTAISNNDNVNPQLSM